MWFIESSLHLTPQQESLVESAQNAVADGDRAALVQLKPELEALIEILAATQDFAMDFIDGQVE